MDKKLPELFFSTSNKRVSEYQKRLRDEGLIRKVAPRLYSSVPEDEWPEVIPRNWAFIIDKLFPGTLLSYRSAMEFTPSPDGTIYLTSGTTRVVSYPGLRISFLRGPAPLEDDGNFLSNLRSSSLPRACLENLRPLRSTNKKRIWPREQLESRLEEYLRINGENFINTLRDRAKEIAVGFGWLGEFEKLNQILGAIPGTRRLPRERSLLVKPFDSRCLERLTSLYSYLKTTPLKSFPETLTDNNHFRNKAFFESYFSNYIEGTTFKIEEAEQIVFDRYLPPDRPQDAHDVLSTFQIVSDRNEISRTPESVFGLFELLIHRHRIIMNKRPDKRPGMFKNHVNRAGDTEFVHPEYVEGTLEQGYHLYSSLEPGLQRGIFIKFLVSEVHPFDDGNGRISRIMMNAELFSSNLCTVIIPTVYREDYLLTLRALSRRMRPAPYVTMLTEAHRFSGQLDFSHYPSVLQAITERNWFLEPDNGKIIYDRT